MNILYIKKKKEKHSLQQSRKMKQKKKQEMADLKKFTTTLLQLHCFSSQIKPYLSRKGKKKTKKPEETVRLLADRGTHTGTAKLVLDIINTQKNDAL